MQASNTSMNSIESIVPISDLFRSEETFERKFLEKKLKLKPHSDSLLVNDLYIVLITDSAYAEL